MARPILMACDPGIASFGAVLIDILREDVIAADVFTSKPAPKKDRRPGEPIVRARELAAWLQAFARRGPAGSPDVIASEVVQGSRSGKAAIGMGIGLGVLATFAELRGVPSVAATPRQWRTALAGVNDEGKAQARAREVFDVSESAVQAAMPYVSARDAVHAFDALGIGAWAVTTDFVRELVRSAA